MKHNISTEDKNEKKKTLSTHYELNHIPLNSHIAVLTHSVAVFGDRSPGESVLISNARMHLRFPSER